MRLAIIRQDYRPGAPIERFVETALEALLERNVAVSLYTREVAPTRLQLIEQVACDPPHFGRSWRDAGFAHRVCSTIGAAHANLVEAHEPLRCCDIYRADHGLYASRFAGEDDDAPGGILRRFSPRRQYLLAAERQMFGSRWLQTVICPSRLVRDDVRSRYGWPEDRLPVIPLPVDSDALTPALRAQRDAVLDHHRIAADATVFLWHAHDEPGTGLRTTIDAFASMPAGTHLVVLLPPGCRRNRAVLAAGDRVTIVGEAADRLAYLGAADVFLQPRGYDPQPIVALEAMAAGVPVVAGPRTGIATLVRDADAGIAIAQESAAEAAAAMRALLDPAARRAKSRRARAAVLPFTPAAMTLKLVLLYRDLLAATVRPHPEPDGRHPRAALKAVPPA